MENYQTKELKALRKAARAVVKAHDRGKTEGHTRAQLWDRIEEMRELLDD